MDFWTLPWWAYLLICFGVWLLIGLLEFFEPTLKAIRDINTAEAIAQKRQFFGVTVTSPSRWIEYKFADVYHRAEVSMVTQVEPDVIAFTDTEGRSFLVHTDEWREINVPVGLEDYADE